MQISINVVFLIKIHRIFPRGNRDLLNNANALRIPEKENKVKGNVNQIFGFLFFISYNHSQDPAVVAWSVKALVLAFS